jgi:hypothetical protein
MLVSILSWSPSARGKTIALRLRPAAHAPDLPLTRLRDGLCPGCTLAKLPSPTLPDASTDQSMARRWRDQR